MNITLERWKTDPDFDFDSVADEIIEEVRNAPDKNIDCVWCDIADIAINLIGDGEIEEGSWHHELSTGIVLATVIGEEIQDKYDEQIAQELTNND